MGTQLVSKLPLFIVHSTRIYVQHSSLVYWEDGIGVLNTKSYPIDGSLQVFVPVPDLKYKGVLLMEIMAFVCPDTGDSHTAPVISGTNCT